MTIDPRILDVLLRYEELHEQGQTPLPEELCHACPELLPEVKRRLHELQALDPLFNTWKEDEPDLSRTAGGTPCVRGYQILEEVGRGAVGVVYRAKQLALNRLVALKMILAGAHAGVENLRRFRTEAEAAARLKHPNIVQIFEIGEHDGLPFIALELCTAGNLAAKVNGTPLPYRNAASIAATLARAVQAAHDKGIIHRDLKPANILLQEDDNRATGNRTHDARDAAIPRITDFGLAKILDAESPLEFGAGGLTASGAIMGTPSYMAPEQAGGKGSKIGHAADIYALGAILYEMLSGRPPFRAASVLETLEQVRLQEPISPRLIQPAVPRDLETICLKCLRKEPEQRYARAADLADDLDRFLAGETIQARPTGSLERTWRRVRRRPIGVAVGLVMLAVLLLAGTVIFHQVTDRHERATRVNLGVLAALEEPDRLLADLQARRADVRKAHVLLSELAKWQRQVENARQGVDRATAHAAGNEALLDADSAQRLEDVGARLKREEEYFQLARDLDDIRLEADMLFEGKFDTARAHPSYVKVFGRLGLDLERGDVNSLVKRIADSPVRPALVAALDHWAELTALKKTRDMKFLSRLLEVARQADPDPWRDRFRQANTWYAPAELLALAAAVRHAEQTPHILIALAQRLHETGNDSVPMLRSALIFHPRDFWLLFHLGNYSRDPEERAAQYRAALIIRRDSTAAHFELGLAYMDLKDLDAAVATFRRTIELDPKLALAHCNLGHALSRQKNFREALPAYERGHELGAAQPGWSHPSARWLRDCQASIAAGKQK